MSTPTKSQRHAIYKKALKLFDQDPIGLCLVIAGADGKWAVKDWWEVASHYPEFAKQYNPDKVRGYYGLDNAKWNDLTEAGEDAKRRRALLRCIELSKPTKRVK